MSDFNRPSTNEPGTIAIFGQKSTEIVAAEIDEASMIYVNSHDGRIRVRIAGNQVAVLLRDDTDELEWVPMGPNPTYAYVQPARWG
jgi:hypothetical protein